MLKLNSGGTLMNSKRKWLAAGLLILVALASGGCDFMDKLKARDHLNRGVEAYRMKSYNEAEQEFKAAIELDPELLDAYLYLATTYRVQFVPLVSTPDNLRMAQQAIATFEKVLEKDPVNQNAMANIADLYRNMGEPDKAKEWYRRLMEVQEDKSQALYGIGVIDYNLASEKTGEDGENVQNLSEEELAEVTRVVDEGIEVLRQALQINPRFTNAMEYLNLLYREKAELARDEEERRRWVREADKLALQAVEMKRQLEREAEEARRRLFKAEEERQQQEQKQ
ncbi:MAG TPA: tetratricopeptide repeat protein [Acidobacteriota bacterium]|nr:tetratricopeptide repeat protein [Acidobacteriota bacterium]